MLLGHDVNLTLYDEMLIIHSDMFILVVINPEHNSFGRVFR